MALPTKANTSRPLAAGYHALIEYGDTDAESLYLPLAVGPGRQMTFQVVEPERDRPRLEENPEDLRSESGQSFSRSDFGGGEGLRLAHRRDGTSRDFSRFYDSKGLDITPAPTGEAASLVLATTFSEIRDSQDTSIYRETVVNDGSLYTTTTDNRVDVSDNPTAATPTWSTEDPRAAAGNEKVTSLAVLDGTVYARVNNQGIYTRDAAAAGSGTWSVWSTLDPGNPTRIHAVKGRIIARYQGELWEARAGAASVQLASLSDDSFWFDVADAGEMIVAVNTNGYAYMYKSVDGDLTLQGQTLIGRHQEEECVAVEAFGGLVFIATRHREDNVAKGRLYRGVMVGSQIREIQLLRTWDGFQSHPRSLTRIGDSIYFTIGSTGSTQDLWKYSLTTGGLFRVVEIDEGTGTNSRGESIVSIGSTLFVHVGQTSFGGGLWRQDSIYTDSGYLISALADFYNAGKKTWMGARLTPINLPTGTDVTLHYSTDPDALDNPGHSSWTQIIAMDETTTAGEYSQETAITEEQSRFIALKVTLTPNGTNTATPEIAAFAVRGIPTVTEEDYAIPVNVSDRLEIPGRKPLVAKGAGDTRYNQLRSLIGASATITLLRPDESVVGQLRTLSTPINGLPRRGTPTTYALLGVRGARQ